MGLVPSDSRNPRTEPCDMLLPGLQFDGHPLILRRSILQASGRDEPEMSELPLGLRRSHRF